MLSLHQAIEIKESILEYIKATFTFQDKEVHKAFYEFINHPVDGMFKGPYVSLKLPFVKATEDEQNQVPLTIKPEWAPYDHQVKSWKRLSCYDKSPKPTIITTGTGSGKTESFMFPVLDYCYQNLHRKGIKTIILYPMNALASDQAKRFAQEIYADPRLKGKVTAGLFIGEGKVKQSYQKMMGPENIIEDREMILSSPPDILLTNFKMLDYGLMKSNYHDLWPGNLADPTLLQFLVLDELHTYDGAQGTDVANLIRRLKLKLKMPENHLCPVGTSATIGSGHDAPQLLAAYASKVFGEQISPESIISENRLSVDDFFSSEHDLAYFVPRLKVLNGVKPIAGEGYANYIKRQVDIWQFDQEQLSDELKKLKIVRDLVDVVNRGKGIHLLSGVMKHLSDINDEYSKIPQWDEDHNFNPKEYLLLSLFGLISEAKTSDKKPAPFLYTQTHLWIRELSGVLRLMTDTPRFTWKEVVDSNNDIQALPPWFCRECGASGWLGIKHDNKERFEKDTADIYTKFFSNHKHIYFANCTRWYSQHDATQTGYEATDSIKKNVSGKSLEFEPNPDDGTIDITAFRRLDANGKNDHVCPECNSRNAVSIIGTRTATLSSIAVSQALASDLDAQTEQQRKVLAFTNSVQDAAHQAGFIEARNYRFTFRSSLQKVINQQKNKSDLNTLNTSFLEYWKQNSDETGKRPLDAYYQRFYPTDYAGKSSPADYKNKNGYNKNFQQEFDLRMSWELFAEFGYNAIIGRTLEKTNSSAVEFDSQRVEQALTGFNQWLLENDPEKRINPEKLHRFVLLVLHRMRHRGAISHPYLEKFRSGDLKARNLNWYKDSRHFLNHYFGKRARLPRLITTQPEKRSLLDSTYTTKLNWFHAYYKKTFQSANQYVDFINEFYQHLIGQLHNAGMFDKRDANGMVNYALQPEALKISNRVNTWTCNQCGHELHAADDDHSLEGGLCLHYRCTGIYGQKVQNGTANYYQSVYNRYRSPRIYAADHTGLLDREKREALEIRFKTRPDFDSENAMVATSTLEMGIDIGTLNTAFNNNIPPLPSNFLQRIGRAGRSGGSALIVNFAKKEAHDLYYFNEPLDMMAGEVHPPGCYLEAKEILRRHFFAFCIDSWASADPKSNSIPAKFKYVKLSTAEIESPEFFMNRILRFVKNNEQPLFNAFQSMYVNDINKDVFNEIASSLHDESFYLLNAKVIEQLVGEINNITDKINELKALTIDLNLGNNDPEKIELDKELKNLRGLQQSIRNRQVLEYLTNVGVLPNYAFPEKGVTLSAKVLGSRAEGSVKPPVDVDFEMVRPASQAIRELAPDNFFYSQGFKFKITGLNTYEWKDKDNFHEKRFCSNCDYIEIDEISNTKNCPKCGSESWGTVSNKHYFARITSVKSFNNQVKAKLNDGKEDRESIIFNTQKHFNFVDAVSQGALAMKEIPFGIEFVKNVLLTESNLGRKDVVSARRVKVNQEELSAKGFVTCRYCGKSSSNTNQRDYQYHYAYCKHKDHEYAGKSDDVFDEVFLFRELRTEALKILLPVQELNSDAEIKMFKAGLELGLKKYFKGNPQHINIAEYREFNKVTQKFDSYLVMYDTIPGGTGYLSKLFSKEVFNEVLNIAYSEIKNCECQYRWMDGCYRCIFSYGNQYYRSDLSRQKTEERFYQIIKHRDDWKEHKNGLGTVTNNGQIEESELESRFIRCLRNFAEKYDEWLFSEKNTDGVINYQFEFNNQMGTVISYYIKPQVKLGPDKGVEFYTRPDFLLSCTHIESDNNTVEDISELPAIAIYLDGYQYHASDEINRFENDIEKRKAIIRSGGFYTWTLTWNDLERFEAGLNDSGNDENKANDELFSLLTQDGYKNTVRKLSGALRNRNINLLGAKNNLERLIMLLQQTVNLNVIQKELANYLGAFQPNLFKPSYHPDEVQKALLNSEYDEYCFENRTLKGWVPLRVDEKNLLCEIVAAVNIGQSHVVSKFTLKELKHIDKVLWNRFWMLFNLFQFFDTEVEKRAEIISDTASEYDVESILAYYDEKLHPDIMKMFNEGKIQNEDDEIKLSCLIDQSGNMLAEALLIDHEQKIVINPISTEDEKVFVQAGYEIRDVDNLKTN